MSFTVHKDVMVAMRDGVELATDLWLPDATPAPTLLVRLPYSKDLPALLGYGLVPNLFALVEAGYAVVYQDCRGTFRSAGDFTPMLTEPDDGAAARADCVPGNDDPDWSRQAWRRASRPQDWRSRERPYAA